LGKTGLRCQWQIKQGGFGAAVEKIEEQRKPDDFFGYRKPAAKPKMPQVRILSSGPKKQNPLLWVLLLSVGWAGFEPIAVELSGGQFLPPVQTLVATLIFATRKCISNPVIQTKTHNIY